ncbi:hypothetical protein [Streptomyces sp. CNZ287]|uniref:hypothetical protein n=1 Tax=Streptomyces sp. B22F1 TaxID=3153566 RepID=UPI00119B8CEA
MSGSERLPALCRGLATVVVPAGVVIEGGPHRILLNGETAKEFVPRLLPLLDGVRRVDEASVQLSVAPARIRQAVRLLTDWGVVEDARTDGDLPHESAVFYSRLLATAGAYRGTGELLDELAGARVLLTAGSDAELVRRLRADLTASGVGTVETAGDPAGNSLAVVLDPPGRPEAVGSLVRAAAAEGVPVLRIAYARDAVEAGPLFHPGDPSCAACFRKDYDALGTVLVDGGPAARGVLAGLVATEVLAVLARTTAVCSLRTLLRTSLSDYATERYLFAPDGDCDEEAGGPAVVKAGPAHAESGEPARLVDGYEWYQALPPPGLSAESRLLAPEQEQLQALLHKRPRRMSVPARELPPEPDLPPMRGGLPQSEAVPVPPARLAGLITRTAGLVGAGTGRAGPRRWAPSSGGRGSVELYVVTEADPFGLPGTVFSYDDVGHRMLSVRSDAVPLKDVLAATGLDAGDVTAAVVLVATVGRLYPRYGYFSWRLAHLDAGFAATQLAVAAQGDGVAVSFAATWPEELPHLLQLDQESECVAAVAGLAGATGAAGAAPEEDS